MNPALIDVMIISAKASIRKVLPSYLNVHRNLNLPPNHFLMMIKSETLIRRFSKIYCGRGEVKVD
jgi:hypothetical protein